MLDARARPRPRSRSATCLAIGADRGILLATDGEEWDAAGDRRGDRRRGPRREADFDLIVFGNESADSGNYQVGIRVAHALGPAGASPG